MFKKISDCRSNGRCIIYYIEDDEFKNKNALKFNFDDYHEDVYSKIPYFYIDFHLLLTFYLENKIKIDKIACNLAMFITNLPIYKNKDYYNKNIVEIDIYNKYFSPKMTDELFDSINNNIKIIKIFS